MKERNHLRASYIQILDNRLEVRTKEGRTAYVLLSESQLKEWQALSRHLDPSNSLNLVDVRETEEDLTAGHIILEPDYLVDISSLAECYKPYGHHPLNYTLARLQNRSNSAPILLGNTANYFIDELINEEEDAPADYLASMREMFKTTAFEFSACEDLQDAATEKRFFQDAKRHFDQIKQVIKQSFPRAGIRKEELVVEPSFICNTLGIQGRLDVMMIDSSAFIELKSGKGVEDFRSGGQFLHSASNHAIQTLLYLAVLEYNLNKGSEEIKAYLLYSKYPLLSREYYSEKLLAEVLHLRNQIVAVDYVLQKTNRIDYTREVLGGLNAKHLNTEEMTGKLFENYLAPAIERFGSQFRCLNGEEQSYVLRLYNFIIKEQWYSKVGEREYEGTKRAANLWNASFDEKKSAGEILYDLRIRDNQSGATRPSITLAIPEYPDLYLPNFRQGDVIILYERNREEDTVNNRQVIKGSIACLDNKLVTIRLRSVQRNRLLWNTDGNYALEHDYMDSSFINQFKSLSTFISANPERRDLLLGKRLPRQGASDFSDKKDDLERSIRKALAAPDCFLLVGPPGTGKTSLALKQIVARKLESEPGSNILLLSYTNRAVDEICKTLTETGEPFIRIGSELNCEPEYRPYLLGRQLDACRSRKEVIEAIRRCRVFVGTVASISGKPDLFVLKKFDLAVIDEATQLLEPHLLGILSAQTPDGDNAIERFILIGDHKQLPAVVLQSDEESRVIEPVLTDWGINNLKDSLFERLYRKYRAVGADWAYDQLNRQGRMHPQISAFPSEEFYDGRLDSAGLPHQLEEDPSGQRVIFLPVKPDPEDKADKANRAEAREVAHICRNLPEEYQTIGIITPFRNQIALIRKTLQEAGIEYSGKILIDTVERFQGSQCDVIIYSFCIKTPAQLAALPNRMEENGVVVDRKLNVALTRARKKLYIIGNQELLLGDPIYAKLISKQEIGDRR
ncbi:AAA domain-containing protein [Bacteroidales bacterium OttesenSCG-928-L03]|nr:AAA domain-containing protein [Bacteroidales bacterium OttesenSCG-928-L03]